METKQAIVFIWFKNSIGYQLFISFIEQKRYTMYAIIGICTNLARCIYLRSCYCTTYLYGHLVSLARAQPNNDNTQQQQYAHKSKIMKNDLYSLFFWHEIYFITLKTLLLFQNGTLLKNDVVFCFSWHMLQLKISFVSCKL